MKFGAFRGFRDAIWLYLFDLKQAAERRAPWPEVFVYVHAPDPRDPRHRFHTHACGRIIGNALHDAATGATFPIVDAGPSAIVYARGQPAWRIIETFFYNANGDAVMHVDAGFADNAPFRMIPPWRTEEVEKNAEVIRMAERFMPVMAGDGDTTEAVIWLRSRPETPPGILDACAALDEERATEKGTDDD
jgi:hypothetical protein